MVMLIACGLYFIIGLLMVLYYYFNAFFVVGLYYCYAYMTMVLVDLLVVI